MNTVYTDGSCYPNPNGNGGWGYIVLANEEAVRTMKGSEKNTTNNRMELMAILRALESFEDGEDVLIMSDSQYCVNSMMVWMRKWRRKQFSGVKNTDLMKAIDNEMQRLNVKAEWVRGHNGNKWNEAADSLAEEARVLVK